MKVNKKRRRECLNLLFRGQKIKEKMKLRKRSNRKFRVDELVTTNSVKVLTTSE